MNVMLPTVDPAQGTLAPPNSLGRPRKLTHLEQLEAESIHIIREAVAESEKPVLLYSIGKDSSVLLHLALKAFYPGKPPFPLLHIDARRHHPENRREPVFGTARPPHRSRRQRRHGAQEAGGLFLMNVQPVPSLFGAGAFLPPQEPKSLLRFIVCGSIDHGKSPLIGRLLYESGLVFADQLDALDHESRRYGTQ